MKRHERVSLQDLIDTCQAKAIANKLLSTEETVYRDLCREYSLVFHTPLHIVMQDLDPEHVVLTIFEHQLKDAELDDYEVLEMLVDRLNSIEDPDYESSKESDLQRFIEKSEKEEEDRLDNGRPVHKALRKRAKKILPEKEAPKPEKKKGGYMNLKYLEEHDKGESGEF